MLQQDVCMEEGHFCFINHTFIVQELKYIGLGLLNPSLCRHEQDCWYVDS